MSPDDSELDDLLRAAFRPEASTPEDAGFTDRVMQRLPPRRAPLRPFVLGTAVALSLLLVWLSPAQGFVTDVIASLAARDDTSPGSVVALVALVAAVLGASAYAAAPQES